MPESDTTNEQKVAVAFAGFNPRLVEIPNYEFSEGKYDVEIGFNIKIRKDLSLIVFEVGLEISPDDKTSKTDKIEIQCEVFFLARGLSTFLKENKVVLPKNFVAFLFQYVDLFLRGFLLGKFHSTKLEGFLPDTLSLGDELGETIEAEYLDTEESVAS